MNFSLNLEADSAYLEDMKKDLARIGQLQGAATVLLLFAISNGLFQSLARAHEVAAPKTVAASREDVVTVKATNQVLGPLRQMTFVGPRAGEGYFSQDGKLLIFQSEREPENPFYQIFVLNRASGKTVRVSPGEGKTTCAWIHPSKTKALFSSTHLDPMIKDKVAKEIAERKNPVKGKYAWSYDKTFDIFEAPLANALTTGRPVDAKNLKRLTKEIGYDAEASYSPDGSKIAFASNRSGYSEALSDEDKKLFSQDPSYMMDLYLMNADGTNVERLTTERGYDGGPFFSADGKRLTWRRFSKNGQVAEIMTMDLKTRKELQLTNLKSMSWAPYFHPSGDYVIFTTNKLGYTNFELYIVDSEGKGEPVRVSFLPGFDGLPVFLPSGRELSWTRKDEKGESQLYIASWDDGYARSLLGLGRPAPTLSELSREIRESDTKAWVSYLTGAPLKGRKPGTIEERVYSDAIGRSLRSMGLEPVFGKSYVQAFEFTSGISLGPLNRMRLRENGEGSDLRIETEWMPLSISNSGDVRETGLVFVGYGIVAPASDKQPAFDSYVGADVAGKWVVALRDLPSEVSSETRFHFNPYSRAQHKSLVAKQKGAVGLILIDSPTMNVAGNTKSLAKLKFEGASEVGIPVIHVSSAIAARLFRESKGLLKEKIVGLDRGEVWVEELKATLGGKVDLQFQKSTALNVAAKRRGKKRDLAPLIIGAHGDHLGLGESGASLAKQDEQGEIHHGADDNASGVASLLELAHAWSDPKLTPNRDIVFAMWSAEELGILGSTYFLKEWKGKKPFAYINMDMVGRLRDSVSVQGVGSATEWRELFETWAERWPLAISAVSDPYLPTDAMSFYVKEIPILSFFTGAHAEYHSPRDRFETLNFSGLNLITKTVNVVVSDLASSQKNLTWLKVESGQPLMGEGRSFRLYLGTVPDYSQEGVKGVKISGTSKDSPAESAGLVSGDVIVGLGGIKIDSIYDYVYCLQALKADVTVPIQVVRAGRQMDLKITPRLKTGG